MAGSQYHDHFEADHHSPKPLRLLWTTRVKKSIFLTVPYSSIQPILLSISYRLGGRLSDKHDVGPSHLCGVRNHRQIHREDKEVEEFTVYHRSLI